MDRNNILKDELDKLVCPVHHQHGSVETTEKGFVFHCCCEEFEAKFKELFVKALSERLTNTLFNKG